MHTIIAIRLIQSRWNYEVLGWNISYLFLAIILWKDCWNRNQVVKSSDDRKRRARSKKEGSKLLWVYCFLFLIMPAAVPFGLDPYLGMALYTENLPLLEIELPVAFNNNIYEQWGLVDEKFYPAITSDHRRIARVDYIAFNVKTKNTVGYSSVWAQQQFVSSLCDKLRAFNVSNVEDSRFFQLPHYTGWILLESLWTIIVSVLTKNTTGKQAIRTMFVREGCSNDWYSISTSDLKHQIPVSFTSNLQEPFELFYFHADGSTPTLIPQTEMNAGKVAKMNSFSGHIFVAARRINSNNDNDMKNLCSLMVWTVAPTTESKPQNFILEEHQTIGADQGITLPGLKSCAKDHINSDHYSCDKNDDNTQCALH